MKKKVCNSFHLTIPALSENERFARQIVSAFVAPLDPTVEQLADLRTAVSEAVTNCIVHAYRGQDPEKSLIYISAKTTDDGVLTVKIRDHGCGMDDIQRCLEPLYTTDPAGERGGMGFAIMESFTDRMRVLSKPGRGTTVTLVKKIAE